jgi:hypothetical protein
VSDLSEWFDTSKLTPDEKRTFEVFVNVLTAQINKACHDARREALEEAARIHIPPPLAVPGFIRHRDDYNAGHQGGQAELREAIRALIGQEPTP